MSTRERDALLARPREGVRARADDSPEDVERAMPRSDASESGRGRRTVVVTLVLGALGASAGVAREGGRAGTAALGVAPGATCSREHPGYAAPFAGAFEHIGEWPVNYLRADARCGSARDGDSTVAGEEAILGKSRERPNQEKINSFMTDWSASFGDRAYAIPPNGKKKDVSMQNNSALVYNFVHVPKAGGSYFSNAMIKAYDVSGERHGYAYPLKAQPFKHMITLPLIDATQLHVRETTESFRTKSPPEYFGSERLKALYEKGSRMFIKGQFGMGMCDVIDAPCLYFTVLRDPVSRYLSHYKYSCLSGAEGKAQWTDEWKELGYCPLDPVEFMDHLGINLDWTVELAPGGKTPEQTATMAMKNLDSGCMRYLLTEQYADGLNKLSATFPDFEFAVKRLREIKNVHGAENAAKPLAASEEARYKAYANNATMMNIIADRHALMKRVYDHAVAKYEANWARPPRAC